MDPAFVADFLKTIDCYVMGSRIFETALAFEAKGFGWAYGDKPTFVLTRRELRKTRDTVQFYSGDLAQLVNERLRPAYRSIWVVGGGAVCGECLRRGLADEVRYSIMPTFTKAGQLSTTWIVAGSVAWTCGTATMNRWPSAESALMLVVMGGRLSCC